MLLLFTRWHHARFCGYKDKDVVKEFTIQRREKDKPKRIFSVERLWDKGNRVRLERGASDHKTLGWQT